MDFGVMAPPETVNFAVSGGASLAWMTTRHKRGSLPCLVPEWITRAILPSIRIVIEISLNVYERCALVSGTGCQVAQGAQQVGQAAWGGTLSDHLAYQVGVLFFDGAFDGGFQFVASQVAEPLTGAVSRSSIPRTTSPPAAFTSLLVRARVWMASQITLSV